MAEEFQESEVIFQENIEDENSIRSSFPLRELIRNNEGKRRKLKAMKKKRSVPVSIPMNPSRSRWFRGEIDDGGDDGEMVPPHVIVGRRVAGKIMAFSICTGNGMMMKGRDLSEFRNLILRMTGFLET